MIERASSRWSLVAVGLLVLATAGCKKRLTPAEREAWTTRVAGICKCQQAECMGKAETNPPVLAAPFDDYAKDDQEFVKASADAAKACLDKQLRDAEKKGD